jgi:opacity protein-like surface antigen
MGKRRLDGRRFRVAGIVAAACVAAACPAFAVPVSVSLSGGAAVPLGGPASSDLGHFNWLIRDNPGSEHDLVDICGLTLTGSDAAVCPAAAGEVAFGVLPWMEVEGSVCHLFSRARDTAPKSAIVDPRTDITWMAGGATFARDAGRFRPYVGAGLGYYFTKVSFYASGEGRSGFVYSNVYTLEESVATSSWGWYAGGGVSYPLFGRAALDLGARYHRVMNGDTYEISIHERYGYDPYHYTEYVFDTPVHKEYDDQFVAITLGVTYRVL